MYRLFFLSRKQCYHLGSTNVDFFFLNETISLQLFFVFNKRVKGCWAEDSPKTPDQIPN